MKILNLLTSLSNALHLQRTRQNCILIHKYTEKLYDCEKRVPREILMSVKKEQTHNRHTIMMVIEFVRLVLQLQTHRYGMYTDYIHTHTQTCDRSFSHSFGSGVCVR